MCAEQKLLWPFLRWKDWLRFRLFSEEWGLLLKALMMGVIGIGAMQINSALDAIFARMADPEGPAFLWYAIRIEQVPLALFGAALSGALLPPLSRAMKAGQIERYRQMLQSGLRSSTGLMLVCTFGIFALGGSGINLLYGRGDFSPADVAKTAPCLWAYGAGLVPAVMVLLFASGFYAQKSYGPPMIASLTAVGVNLFLNALFVFGFQWGAISIALATSIGAVVNVIVLAFALHKKVGQVFSVSFWKFFVKTTLACSAAAFTAGSVKTFWLQEGFPRGFMAQIQELACLSAVFILTLGAVGWMLRISLREEGLPQEAASPIID
jgi:putative peptidoglycan lipid II flippase